MVTTNQAGNSDPTASTLLLFGHPSLPSGFQISQVSETTTESSMVLSWEENSYWPSAISSQLIPPDQFTFEIATSSNSSILNVEGIYRTKIRVIWTLELDKFLMNFGDTRNGRLQGQRGDTLQVRMQVKNALFTSSWSEWQSLRILGLPSSDVHIHAMESAPQVMKLSWQSPSDTGWGDSTAILVSYYIEVRSQSPY